MSTIRYITHTRKGDNATKVSEITHYKYFRYDNTEKYYMTTKEDFCNRHYEDGCVFSYSPKGEKAECELKTSSISKEKYLQTIGNGTVTDNLLNLPDV